MYYENKSNIPLLFSEHPGVDRFYSHENFVIGSRGSADFYYESSCCVPDFSVAADDVVGNVRVCQAGRESDDGSAAAQTASLGIALIVIAVVLVIVILVAVGVIIFIRRRRKAEKCVIQYTCKCIENLCSSHVNFIFYMCMFLI